MADDGKVIHVCQPFDASDTKVSESLSFNMTVIVITLNTSELERNGL